MIFSRKMLFVFAGMCVVFSAVQAQTLVEKLRNGGSLSFKINDASYNVTGGITLSGNFGASDPVEFFFESLPNGNNTGLDIRFPIRDLISIIDSDYEAEFIATIIDDSTVEWNLRATDLGCVPVEIEGSAVNFRIDLVTSKLRLRLSQIACQSDPNGELSRNVSIAAAPIGGNAMNFLTAGGYIFCSELPFFVTNARIENIQMSNYGGGLPKSLGNVNGDCAVNDDDLLQVLFNFGTNDPASDTNDDGQVNDVDLLTVLFNFGLQG